MTKYYWMAVTADKYELPLAVAESSFSLAIMLGVHKGTVLACEARSRSGKKDNKSKSPCMRSQLIQGQEPTNQSRQQVYCYYNLINHLLQYEKEK